MKARYTLPLAALFSTSALAIVDGTPVDWYADHDDLVYMNCTSTVIGGHYVLTAAHCSIQDANFTFQAEDGSSGIAMVEVTTLEKHPEMHHGATYYKDVAIGTLGQRIESRNITYFRDLSTPFVMPYGESTTILGFGGTGLDLHQADMMFIDWQVEIPGYSTVEKQEVRLLTKEANNGATTFGDSGGPWVYNNELIGLTSAGGTHTDKDGNSINTTAGTDLHYVKDFLLEHVDGWHFPTLVDVDGVTTIKVQSLHLNPSRDAAYTTGDVTLIGGTCLGASHIEAFETCTYEIESNGGEGTLVLSDKANEYITVNRPVIEEESNTETTPPSGGSSGGSTGLISVFALLGLLRARRR